MTPDEQFAAVRRWIERVGRIPVRDTKEPNIFLVGSLRLTSGEVYDLGEEIGFDSTKAIIDG